MIPLKDQNPTTRPAIVTGLIIAACTVIFVFVQPGRGSNVESAKFTYRTAAIPCEILHGRPLSVDELSTRTCEARPEGGEPFPGKSVYLSILYSMFLHGSWLHLAGNMLFLWIFGNNIEDRRGPVRYLVFYVLAGLAATAAQIALDPRSTIPMVGASGAIAGVMGAYLVLFPNVRIRSLIFLGFFVFFRDIKAKWLLGIWFLTQFLVPSDSGVAWMAHVGGFVFGALAGLLWRNSDRVA